MPDGIRVKICGLRDTAMIDVAALTGVAYVGLVCFPKSPRAVSVAEAAPMANAVANPERSPFAAIETRVTSPSPAASTSWSAISTP